MENPEVSTEPPSEPLPEPVRIEYYPESFVEFLQNRRTEKNYSPKPELTIPDFYKQLTASEDYKYNHFKISLYKIIFQWECELSSHYADTFKPSEHYVLILFFNLLVSYVKDNTTRVDLKLDHFFQFMDEHDNAMFADFNKHSWYCLLSVLDSSTVQDPEPQISPKESKISGGSKSRRSSNLSNAANLRLTFNNQLACLKHLATGSFSRSFHFELLRQMVGKTHVWNVFRSADHRLNTARTFVDPKKSKKAAAKEEVVDDNKTVLLPLKLSAYITDEFWNILFDEVPA